MFDWLEFLKHNNIEYITAGGAGTAKGNVYVVCPFCARQHDEHMRMGISILGKGWGCWRNEDHRGARPHKLVQALLGCSYEEAQRIVGDVAGLPGIADATFGDAIAMMLSPGRAPAAKRGALEWPAEIRPLAGAGAAPFAAYIQARGYSKIEAGEICDLYSLRYARHGVFRFRVCFPISLGGKLTGWTGRSILPDQDLRYLALTTDAEKAKKWRTPLALRSVYHSIWNYDDIARDANAHTLVLCEGPFDALRLDYYGRMFGLRAGCLFGKSISEPQIVLLENLAPRFKQRLLMLDDNSLFQSFGSSLRLAYLDFKVQALPEYAKEPENVRLDWVRSIAERKYLYQ